MIGTSLCSALAFFDELLDGGSECPDMGVGCVEGGHPFRWLVCITFDGDPSDRDDSTELRVAVGAGHWPCALQLGGRLVRR